MSQLTVTTWTCDRCDCTSATGEGWQRFALGVDEGGFNDEGYYVFFPDVEDVCPSCVTALEREALATRERKAAAEEAARREYWGLCPGCGQECCSSEADDGYRWDCSWGRVCELLWRAGAWHDETRDQQRENFADTFLRETA